MTLPSAAGAKLWEWCDHFAVHPNSEATRVAAHAGQKVSPASILSRVPHPRCPSPASPARYLLLSGDQFRSLSVGTLDTACRTFRHERTVVDAGADAACWAADGARCAFNVSVFLAVCLVGCASTAWSPKSTKALK